MGQKQTFYKVPEEQPFFLSHWGQLEKLDRQKIIL
jgi:hypothetical protein